MTADTRQQDLDRDEALKAARTDPRLCAGCGAAAAMCVYWKMHGYRSCCPDCKHLTLMNIDHTTTDIYGRPCSVTIVRQFANGWELGAGTDDGKYFVYDRHSGERWHKHCGPYSTFDQAKDWIDAIREGR